MIEASLKEIALPESGYKAFIATRLTFGEFNKINNVMIQNASADVNLQGDVTPSFNGEAVIRFNEMRLLTIIKKILNEKGEDMGVSMDVINSLPVEDGELLDGECTNVINNVKKKQSKKATK